LIFFIKVLVGECEEECEGCEDCSGVEGGQDEGLFVLMSVNWPNVMASIL